MKNLQKMGGIGALYLAAAYIVGMVGFLAVVDISGIVDPVQKVASLAENQTILSILHLLVYVVFGVFLVVLALALYDRLKAGSPAIAQVAAVFGLIWSGLLIASGTLYNEGMDTVIALSSTDPAQAGTVWLTIETVFRGLSGIEIVGSIWILLVSWGAFRGGELPKALNYLGVVIGIAGLLTVIPALFDIVVMVFALGQIVWFVWLGIILLPRQFKR